MADLTDLNDVITQLTTVVAGLSGSPLAPTSPPEAINSFPVAVTYYTGGTFDYSQSGPAIGLHDINVDLHVGRSHLPHDEAYARPFILRMLVAMAANVQVSSTCEYCLLDAYEYGRLGYGKVETFGIRFKFKVKIKHSVTVSA